MMGSDGFRKAKNLFLKGRNSVVVISCEWVRSELASPAV
jgi:hypothetical protein